MTRRGPGINDTKRDGAARPVGILAGGGALPVELASALRRQGREVVLVAIEGEGEGWSARTDAVVRNFGQIGGIVSAFRSRGVRELLIVGSVKRPDLFAVRPDFGFFGALSTVLRLVRAGGDDAVLRGVVAYFGSKGLEVIGPAEVAPELVAGPGPLAPLPGLRDGDADLARRAFAALEALAPFDVGQALIIGPNGIEAIEGAEGTDAMLERVAQARRDEIRSRRGAAWGLLVKRPKAGQDLRVDLPAIGPRTVVNAVGAHLAGIALEAGRVIVLTREEVVARALVAELPIVGIAPAASAPSAGRRTPSETAHDVVLQGGKRMSRLDKRDCLRGVRIADALAPFEAGGSVVTVRGHVLAVQANEPVGAVVARAAALKQWGSSRWSRRSGVAVVTGGRAATPDLIAAIAEAGLAGIAVRPQKFAARLQEAAVREADRHGIFAAEVVAGVRGPGAGGAVS